MESIDIPGAWGYSHYTANDRVRVGVLDTGTLTTHEDLQGNLDLSVQGINYDLYEKDNNSTPPLMNSSVYNDLFKQYGTIVATWKHLSGGQSDSDVKYWYAEMWDHGTSVAGIIGAVFGGPVKNNQAQGVNSISQKNNVKVVPFNVFKFDSSKKNVGVYNSWAAYDLLHDKEQTFS